MNPTRLAGATLVAALLAAGATAGAASPKQVTCTFDLVDVSPATSVTAEDFGAVDCKRHFGRGVQHDTVTTVATTPTTGTSAGRYKQFFDAGTVSGAVKPALTGTPNGVFHTT